MFTRMFQIFCSLVTRNLKLNFLFFIFFLLPLLFQNFETPFLHGALGNDLIGLADGPALPKNQHHFSEN